MEDGSPAVSDAGKTLCSPCSEAERSGLTPQEATPRSEGTAERPSEGSKVLFAVAGADGDSPLE